MRSGGRCRQRQRRLRPRGHRSPSRPSAKSAGRPPQAHTSVAACLRSTRVWGASPVVTVPLCRQCHCVSGGGVWVLCARSGGLPSTTNTQLPQVHGRVRARRSVVSGAPLTAAPVRSSRAREGAVVARRAHCSSSLVDLPPVQRSTPGRRQKKRGGSVAVFEWDGASLRTAYDRRVHSARLRRSSCAVLPARCVRRTVTHVT